MVKDEIVDLISNPEGKIQVLLELVEDFNKGIRERPAQWGTADEIEMQFFLIDLIDQVLTLDQGNIKFFVRELSWRAFLEFKGGFEGFRYATQYFTSINSNPNFDKWAEFLNLRDEYIKWKNVKIESIHNPEDNKLINLLPKFDDRQLEILVFWFIRNPSVKAINYYKQKVKHCYAINEKYTLLLASSGDHDVQGWAINNISNPIYRNLALKIISASPNGDSESIITNAININCIKDISCVLQGYTYKTNSNNVFCNIEKIIDSNIVVQQLQMDIICALSGPAHFDKKNVTYIINKLDNKTRG